MNGNIFARLTGTKRSLVALLASGAMLTAGCSNMATTSPGVDSLATSGTIGGRVHGGNQPVSGATVKLYFAGQTGNAGAATFAATTTTASDGSGAFNFVESPSSANDGSNNTFHCPTNVGSPLVYVVAKGGNTLNNGNSSVNNTAAAFIAVYGRCGDLASHNFVDMTELTTVATMAAVQQFFNPADDSISADGTGQQYNIMLNLPNTIALLADVTKGTAVNSTVINANTANGSNGVGGVTITATPETSKLNTIADAISACVNNASASATACTTLFANATSPAPSVTSRPVGTTFPPATDVVQATYYILTNPTNGGATNLQNIYNLGTAVGAPYQPTLVTQPTDWNIAISYSSISTCGSGSGGFISQPSDINVDFQDDVWIANSQATKGNLSEISSAGAATTCVFLGGGSKGSAIDSTGNVWLATTESNNIYRYNPVDLNSLAFPTTSTPLGVTADGLGNVYFSSSANQSLYKIAGAATATSAVAPVQISSVVGTNPIRMMPDNQGTTSASNIWVSSGNGFVSRVSPGTGGPNVLNGFSTTPFSIGVQSYGLEVTAANDVVVSSGSTDNYLIYLSKAAGYAPAWTTSSGFAGINNPTAIALDGANNTWIPNNTNTSVLVGSVSQVSGAGNALSPATTGFQKSSSYLSSGRAAAVDQAGNVWVIGDGTTNSITEIVGAGVPIYQPYAKGLAAGRFQTIP